jgi:hypothetical protein
MGKLIFVILFSVFCLALALVPEFAMYFTWNLIHPESDLARLLVVALFWVCGAGLCVFFGFLSFMIWVAGISSVPRF